MSDQHPSTSPTNLANPAKEASSPRCDPPTPGLGRQRRPALWLALVLLLLQPGSNLVYSGRWRLGWWVTGLYLALQVGTLVAMLRWAPQQAGQLALVVGLVVAAQALLLLVALVGSVAVHLRYRRQGYPRPFRRLTAGYAVALALFLSTVQGAMVLSLLPNDTVLTIHTFTIPSGYMMPGYQVGDVLLAVRPTNPLERGQALVFKPSDADGAPYYIKRLIGLPGDRIALERHRAIVNGQPEAWQSRDTSDPGALRACLGQHCYDLQIDRPGLTGPGSGANMDERLLGPDEYFFLGDHRDQSLDSRFARLGSQPARRIYYRALLMIWPLGHWGRLDARAQP